MNVLPTFLGIEPFIPIVALCYFIGVTLKAVKNETLDRFIPEILAFFGGGVAVLLYFTIPGYLPAFAVNWFAALILGIISGAVAVFINQVWKQSTKEEYYEKETEEDLPLDEEDEKTDSEVS